ncbi:MAG: VanZ family protein, partial [Planctomycetota bacterium]
MNGTTKFPRKIRRTLLVGCVTLWTAAFLATHVPLPALSTAVPSDKVLHFAGYLVISGLFVLTLFAYNIRRWRRVIEVI